MAIISLAIVLLSAGQASAVASTDCMPADQALNALRSVHETARRAHLEGNAELLTVNTAEEIISVSNGDLALRTKADSLTFFKNYFQRVKYLEWSDVVPPVIRLSPDGQMGWMAVQIRARYIEPAKPDLGERTFKSSWIATYQRVGCAWHMTGNASAVVNEKNAH